MHLFAQEPRAIEGLVARDETTEAIAKRHLVADALGKGNASLHTTKDEDFLHTVVTTVGVVEGLDDDTYAPHEHGGEGIDEDGGLEAWGHVDVGMTALCLQLVHKAHEDSSRNVGIGNAGEVDEGRVSHHATEGVECEEGNDIGEEADAEAKGEL